MVWKKIPMFLSRNKKVSQLSLLLLISASLFSANIFQEVPDTVFNTYKNYSINISGDTTLQIRIDTLIISKVKPTPPVKPWTLGNSFAFNLTQSQLVNWAAGGNNSVAGQIGNFAWIKYKSDKITWDNELDMQYGMSRQEITTETFSTLKTNDKIDFTSNFGFKASKKWQYSLQLNFKTQFDKGKNNPEDDVYVSNFMSPGYLLGTVGMKYKPVDNFKILLSPLTSKVTFVLDQTLSDIGSFGLDPGQTVRSEIGGYIRINYSKELFKNIHISTQLELFSSYKENPENVDVNWVVKLDMKINDYLSADINTNLIYDKDVSMKVQFMEVISVGFKYKIESK